MGAGSVFAMVTFVIKSFFARLAVDIRLIALIAIPFLGYISTEFERKRNAHSSMHHVCNGARSLQNW